MSNLERRVEALEGAGSSGRFLVVTGPEGLDARAAAISAGYNPDEGMLVAISKPEPCEVTVRALPVFGTYEERLRGIS